MMVLSYCKSTAKYSTHDVFAECTRHSQGYIIRVDNHSLDLMCEIDCGHNSTMTARAFFECM